MYRLRSTWIFKHLPGVTRWARVWNISCSEMICSCLFISASPAPPAFPPPLFFLCVLHILHFRLFFRIICFNFKYESCMCKKKKKCTYLQSLPLVKTQTNNNYSRNLLTLTPSSELIIHAAQPRAIPPCSGKQRELERVRSLLCNIPQLIWPGAPPKATQVMFHADSSFPAFQGNNKIYSSLHTWALVPPRRFLFREMSGRGIFRGGTSNTCRDGNTL